MHARDTWYAYSVALEVDPNLANSIEEKHLINKAESVLEDELGEAAMWFEVAAVEGDDQRVMFELRVGTAHTHDVGEEESRTKAEEWASEMFDRVDAPVAIDDLEYRGVTVPTDEGDVPIEAYRSGDDDSDVDESGATATVGTDSPTDGSDALEPGDKSSEQETGKSVTREQAMGG